MLCFNWSCQHCIAGQDGTAGSEYCQFDCQLPNSFSNLADHAYTLIARTREAVNPSLNSSLGVPYFQTQTWLDFEKIFWIMKRCSYLSFWSYPASDVCSWLKLKSYLETELFQISYSLLPWEINLHKTLSYIMLDKNKNVNRLGFWTNKRIFIENKVKFLNGNIFWKSVQIKRFFLNLCWNYVKHFKH